MDIQESKHRNSRRFCLALLAAGGLLSASLARADWKADWDKTLAEAKGQSLNLIIQPSEGYEAVVNEFKKRFPQIKVQATLMHPTDAGPRVLTEQQNGLFAWDAWWATGSNMNNIVLPAGGLEKITDYLVLPEVKDEANWRAPNYLYTSKRGPYVFVHTHFIQILGAYNTRLVPGGKLTMDNLLDPSLKGKYSIRQPSRPHGGAMMLAQIGKEKGIGTVEKILSDMAPVYVDNDRQNFMAVMKGTAAVGLGTPDGILFDCKKEGGCEDVRFFPTGFLHSRAVSVFKNAPNKAAATVWVNWLLSKEGQDVYVREWSKYNPTGAFSMRKDVAGDPRHADSMPDFGNLSKYVAVSLDSGTGELKQVIDMYNARRKK
jgi:ABC-type Fe3+ transport system substrate-binding protein